MRLAVPRLALLLVLAGALPGVAQAAAPPFLMAPGLDRPVAFDCTTASGCPAGASGSANGQFNVPSGVAASGSDLYVANTGNNRIDVFDAATGAFERTFATNGTGAGQVNSPGGLA